MKIDPKTLKRVSPEDYRKRKKKEEQKKEEEKK